MERLINEIINNSKNIKYPFELIAPSKNKYIILDIDEHFITYKLRVLGKKETCNFNMWSKPFLKLLLNKIQEIIEV